MHFLQVTIELFHNAEGKEEFGEPFMGLKNTPVCEFMTTFYKENVFDKIRYYSNLPAPEECPFNVVSCYCFSMFIIFFLISNEFHRTTLKLEIFHSILIIMVSLPVVDCGELIFYSQKVELPKLDFKYL